MFDVSAVLLQNAFETTTSPRHHDD